MSTAASDSSAPGGQPAMAADGPVSYALVQAAKSHKAVVAGLLRDVGLYPGQELLLMHLSDRDDRTQAELVRALKLDASTVTRMVARLEDQGVVRRRASAVDRRAVIVSLTQRGETLCHDVRRIWAELEAVTTGQMSERQRDEILQALRRLAQRLAASAT